MAKSWTRWTSIPRVAAFEEATEDGPLHHRSGELRRVSDALERYPSARADDPLMALLDVSDAVVEWVAANPKESRRRNGGSPVNLDNPHSAPRGPGDKLFALVQAAMGIESPGEVDTFCAFNIGTAHAREESDNILVKLYHQAGGVNGLGTQVSHLNHGPGHAASDERGGSDLLGGIFGHGLQRRLRLTIKRIELARPKRVLLVGHSRGAVLSYLVANEMKRRRFPATVEIFNIDPVAMTLSGGDDRNSLARNVVSHTIITMENETSMIFPVTYASGSGFNGSTPYIGDDVTTQVTQVLPMPGGHGSCTQTQTPIGRVAFGIVRRWLSMKGVRLVDHPPSETEICDLLFKLHADSPIKFHQGRAVSRKVEDDGEIEQKKFARGRFKGAKRSLGLQTFDNAVNASRVTEWKASPFFINHLHERYFASHFPTLHKVLCTGRPGPPVDGKHRAAQVRADRDWQRRRQQLRVTSRAAVGNLSTELGRALGFPATAALFRTLGLV